MNNVMADYWWITPLGYAYYKIDSYNTKPLITYKRWIYMLLYFSFYVISSENSFGKTLRAEASPVESKLCILILLNNIMLKHDAYGIFSDKNVPNRSKDGKKIVW